MACLFIARLPAMTSVEAFEGELVLPRGARGPLLQTLKSKCRQVRSAVPKAMHIALFSLYL